MFCYRGVPHGAGAQGQDPGEESFVSHLGWHRDREKSRTALCRVEPKKSPGRKLEEGVRV